MEIDRLGEKQERRYAVWKRDRPPRGLRGVGSRVVCSAILCCGA